MWTPKCTRGPSSNLEQQPPNQGDDEAVNRGCEGVCTHRGIEEKGRDLLNAAPVPTNCTRPTMLRGSYSHRDGSLPPAVRMCATTTSAPNLGCCSPNLGCFN